ncbi:hypothetical protein BD413DRAFT_495337 [Trametes elegans]|nr:hypothetical protein BD413DRAFT_495337 [Trametes elegans]
MSMRGVAKGTQDGWTRVIVRNAGGLSRLSTTALSARVWEFQGEWWGPDSRVPAEPPDSSAMSVHLETHGSIWRPTAPSGDSTATHEYISAAKVSNKDERIMPEAAKGKRVLSTVTYLAEEIVLSGMTSSDREGVFTYACTPPGQRDCSRHESPNVLHVNTAGALARTTYKSYGTPREARWTECSRQALSRGSPEVASDPSGSAPMPRLRPRYA